MLKSEKLGLMKRSLPRYRQLARELRFARMDGLDCSSVAICNDVCTNISLVFCHMLNAFWNIRDIESALAKQGDLFAAH